MPIPLPIFNGMKTNPPLSQYNGYCYSITITIANVQWNRNNATAAAIPLPCFHNTNVLAAGIEAGMNTKPLIICFKLDLNTRQCNAYTIIIIYDVQYGNGNDVLHARSRDLDAPHSVWHTGQI